MQKMNANVGIDSTLGDDSGVYASVTPDSMSLLGQGPRIDRRRHRRHDFQMSHVTVERYDGNSKNGFGQNVLGKIGRPLGEVIDLSASGLRIRVRHPEMRVGNQVRIRLRLPQYAGISPFVAPDGSGRGTNEWCGWLSVTRMEKVDSDLWDVAGRLGDMREIDRGMLTLYLSAQPLAA